MRAVGGLQMPMRAQGGLHRPVPLLLRPLGLPQLTHPASLGNLLFL